VLSLAVKVTIFGVEFNCSAIVCFNDFELSKITMLENGKNRKKK
jgi:hypothetical protein